MCVCVCLCAPDKSFKCALCFAGSHSSAVVIVVGNVCLLNDSTTCAGGLRHLWRVICMSGAEQPNKKRQIANACKPIYICGNPQPSGKLDLLVHQQRQRPVPYMPRVIQITSSSHRRRMHPIGAHRNLSIYVLC